MIIDLTTNINVSKGMDVTLEEVGQKSIMYKNRFTRYFLPGTFFLLNTRKFLDAKTKVF